MAKKNKIKADSTIRARIKATRKIPPGLPEGLRISYKNEQKRADSLSMQQDSLKRATDSLQRVIIEIKAKQK